MSSSIVGLARTPEHLDVFSVGGDGRMYSAWWRASNPWSIVFPIGGFFPPGAPLAAVARLPNQLDLFVTGNDGRVYTSWWHEGSDWSGLNDSWFQIPSSAPPPPEWLVVDAPSITFGTGLAVGGYGRLTVFSDGTTHFQGHLHDSGFVSYDCLVVFTVKDADGRAYTASHSGRVHGTIGSGSRDVDWDDWGSNDAIRENWPKIRFGGPDGWRAEVTPDFTPLKIAELVVAIVGLVLAIIPLVSGGVGSNKSSDPNYGRPEAYPPGGLPPPDTSVGAAP